MKVKQSRSGSRILAVLEAIAAHQPIGVSALARLLDEDKSATQRALATLAGDGWIRATIDAPTRWELTAHILAVAYAAHGSDDLRLRARPVLEKLRDDSGETILLVMPDVKNFVIADVIESRQVLRMVPDVGHIVAARNTATGRAMLPFLDIDRQMELLEGAPDQSTLEGFELTRQRGYAVSEGEINPAATILAAPIFEFAGKPAGAILVCGLKDRLTPTHLESIGKMLLQAARELSRGGPTPGRSEM